MTRLYVPVHDAPQFLLGIVKVNTEFIFYKENIHPQKVTQFLEI
jgi:hypothetical protein